MPLVDNSQVIAQLTIQQRADAAIAENKQYITDADAWVAANPGTLTLAVLSAQVRQLTRLAALEAKQRNGILRLLLGRFDATD